MKRELIEGVVWAAIMFALALGATYARKLGYIGGDTVTRVVMGPLGLWFLWYGNRMPKAFVPNAQARRARRFAGWAMVLSGLVYAGLFVFAPTLIAMTVGSAAIVAGIVATIAYCLSLRAKPNAA